MFFWAQHQLKDIIWLANFLSNEILLADTDSTGLNNPVLSKSTESLENV